MQQPQLFHEDIFEALRTDIMALGGFKAVGLVLFPDKEHKAGDYLSTCLNTTRPEKLDPAQVHVIKKMAAKVGSYATVFFECDGCNLSRPEPIEPEDERARLQREFIGAVEKLDAIKCQLGRFES